MKIGNPPDKAAPAPAAQTTATTGGTKNAGAAAGTAEAQRANTAATPATPDASAKIALSSAATSLFASSGTAEFDAEKVSRITQLIADGRFKIDPEVIADKLISNARELLTKTAH